MLGVREPEIYGKTTYAELCDIIIAYCGKRNITAECYQSNHEGALVDKIQQAYGDADGIIINPGAYTHTSIALLDTLKSVNIPAVEVHISDPDIREEFRRVSYIRSACIRTIKGHGLNGYTEAIDALAEYLHYEN